MTVAREIDVPGVELAVELTLDHYHGDRQVEMQASVVREGRRERSEESRGYSWHVFDHTCPECGERVQTRQSTKDASFALPAAVWEELVDAAVAEAHRRLRSV